MFHFKHPKHPLRHSVGGQLGWWMSLALMGLALGGCTKTLKVVHGGPALPGEEVDVSPCDPGKYGGTFVMVDIIEPKTFNPEVPEIYIPRRPKAISWTPSFTATR